MVALRAGPLQHALVVNTLTRLLSSDRSISIAGLGAIAQADELPDGRWAANRWPAMGGPMSDRRTRTTRIEWDASFSVGVELLDAQHRRIIGMINVLISNPGATVGSQTIAAVLERLIKYASDHFDAEERILKAYRYPDLARQQADHESYRLKIAAFCGDAMIHRDGVPLELLEFLSDWWLHHVLHEDMKYHRFLNERGVK